MYPYLKELSSNEAYAIQQSNPDCLAYYPKSTNHPNHVSTVGHFIFQGIYGELNHSVFITALDYATHILKQKTPPEGYGYAAYSVDTNSRYSKLRYLSYSTGQWQHGVQELFTAADDVYWHLFCFRLTDLARVEGTDTDKTEINAAQVEDTHKTEINAVQVHWLDVNDCVFQYWQDGHHYPAQVFDGGDTESASEGSKFELLTSTYNSLPQEFKDLAAPIPPSGIKPPVTDWEAKYKELEDRYNESNNKRIVAEAQLMHAKQSLEGAKAQSEIADSYINAFQKKLDLLYQLQENDKELNKLSSDYYPF